MPTVYREVAVDIDVEDVLEEATDAQLLAELEGRKKAPANGSGVTLLKVFEEFQRRGDAPQCLRDYIYDTIGRVL